MLLPSRRMCDGKNRYYTMETATEVLERATRKTGDALRIYTCPICRAYHLTSARSYDPQDDAWDNLRVLQALMAIGPAGLREIGNEAGMQRDRVMAAVSRGVQSGAITRTLCGTVRWEITEMGRRLEARWIGA